MPSNAESEFDRRKNLIRALEVAWMALDGDRLLQRNAKDGEQTTFSEPASGLLREIRQISSELDALGPVEKKEQSRRDDLHARRQERLGNADDSAPAARRGQQRRSNGSHRMG